MPHAAGQHVGNCFKATVEMLWKSINIIRRFKTSKQINHQEWIESLLFILGQDTGKTNPISILGRGTRNQTLNASGAEYGIVLIKKIGILEQSISTVNIPGIRLHTESGHRYVR